MLTPGELVAYQGWGEETTGEAVAYQGWVPSGESIPFKSSVWEKYRQFCAEENLRPMHEKALGNALARFGIIRHRPTGGSVYLKLPVDLSDKIAASRQFFAKDDDVGVGLATAH